MPKIVDIAYRDNVFKWFSLKGLKGIPVRQRYPSFFKATNGYSYTFLFSKKIFHDNALVEVQSVLCEDAMCFKSVTIWRSPLHRSMKKLSKKFSI